MDTTKLRALTYTEMMNGGRQQMDPETQQGEFDVTGRTEALEAAVELLDRSLK